ncbi:MAG: hypothetical protein IPL87_03215 [Candidatus Moraniibacteriota bacterium]|nr:MAG: hypothetical protein IPL87_03215 [Candidatus Moranbacteria bacterium]
MTGPRTIIFGVGGTIELTSTLQITNPYITIAGQTAPGGGITLSGKNFVPRVTGTSLPDQVMVRVGTHNVVLRYIRIRRGYVVNGYNYGSTLLIGTGSKNVVIDHVTSSWSQDDFGIWGGANPHTQPKEITFSNVITSEGLMDHSTGFIVGQNDGLSEYITDIDIHNSLFANMHHRNPLVKNKSFRFINNIVYNWAYYASQFGGGVQADIVGNKYKAGPLYKTSPWVPFDQQREYALQAFPLGNLSTAAGNPSFYIAENVGPFNADPNADNWGMIRLTDGENGSELGPLSTEYRRLSPLPSLPYPILVYSPLDLENRLLPNVGSSHRLDCAGNWIANRDVVDTRIVSDYQNNTGTLIANESEVGGFPFISPGIPCADTDNDGMPDEWEDAHALNKNSASDGTIVQASGYTNLEVYLSGRENFSPCSTLLPSTFPSRSDLNAYGAPYDLFSPQNPLLLEARCASTDTTTLQATIGIPGDNTRVVYMKGYVETGGVWTQVTGINCSGTRNGDWCQGSTSFSLTHPQINTSSSANPSYFVGMTCSVQQGSWKCGCRDSACSQFKWQIQGGGM